MSRQLDNIYKKEKRGKYVFWAWTIVFGFIGIALAHLQQYGISAIMEGLACLFIYLNYRFSQDIEGNICQIAQVNPTRKNKDTSKEEEKPERVEIAPTIVPIEEYLLVKHNPHVLLAGASGTRKSTLMNFLIQKSKRVKIIFNFKSNDIHLSSGLKVVDVSKNAPDPFGDNSAYSSAFNTTYHISPERRAFMATQTPTIVNESLRHSKNFEEQIRYLENEARKKDGATASAVLNQVKPLVIHSKTLHSLDLTEDIVFDFSKFEFDEQKIFYAELVLNMIWNILKKERHEIIVAIEEAHHLVGVPTTKINEFLKEGRSMGVAVYCSLQDYNMIDNGIKTNFATKFIFKTDDGITLGQLKQIPQTNLNEVAHFAEGEFTDVGFPNLKGFVPIFYLVQNRKDLKNIMNVEKAIEILEEQEKISIEGAKPQIAIMQTTTGQSVTMQDREESLRDKILGVLDKSKESLAISVVAKSLYKNESNRDEKNMVKLAVNNELIRLRKEEIIDKEPLVNEKWKTEKHCFRKNENLSKFHTTLQNRSVKLLRNNNITILNVADHQGIQGEDITLSKCVIECESGLKESLGTFNKKVMEYAKSVIIVVPNYEQKERYSHLQNVISGKSKVVLLPELIQAVKEIEK